LGHPVNGSFKEWRKAADNLKKPVNFAPVSEKPDRISFASPELLWRVLTAKRWELLKILCGAGPVSIREAAHCAGRDVKAVHGDVTALLNAGILTRTDKGRIVFPYDAVKVEFLLHAA
jgi:predicted transcriptional regulator